MKKLLLVAAFLFLTNQANAQQMDFIEPGGPSAGDNLSVQSNNVDNHAHHVWMTFVNGDNSTAATANISYDLPVDGVPIMTRFTGKSDVGHTHAESDVVGLVTDLMGKQPANSTLSSLSGLTLGNSKVFATDGSGNISLVDKSTLAGTVLSGTGFVKVSGATVSYDNSTYLTTASAASSYATISHTHPESDVTNLVTDLAAKVPTSRTVNSQPLTSNVSITSVTGNAGTATALAANGTNCSSGQFSQGIDASGNAEGCAAPSSGGRTFSVPSRTVGSCFQISSTNDTDFHYGFDAAIALSLGTNTVSVTSYTNSGCTTGAITEASSSDNGIGLGVTRTIRLDGTIQSGKWAKIAAATTGGLGSTITLRADNREVTQP